ncbi:PREDICTED: uncharacterized protein LOC106148941 [Chinchilla lanigera]|uniref:uncharacterized protein LOC106148941 n=1 Tax=Chinchilla lanigera TaxID=34839 RepID=UPI00069739D1|nr:PREDICTED: uncharacterized protein LOC106148941 [Chinchilla lanigera]
MSKWQALKAQAQLTEKTGPIPGAVTTASYWDKFSLTLTAPSYTILSLRPSRPGAKYAVSYDWGGLDCLLSSFLPAAPQASGAALGRLGTRLLLSRAALATLPSCARTKAKETRQRAEKARAEQKPPVGLRRTHKDLAEKLWLTAVGGIQREAAGNVPSGHSSHLARWRPESCTPRKKLIQMFGGRGLGEEMRLKQGESWRLGKKRANQGMVTAHTCVTSILGS